MLIPMPFEHRSVYLIETAQSRGGRSQIHIVRNELGALQIRSIKLWRDLSIDSYQPTLRPVGMRIVRERSTAVSV